MRRLMLLAALSVYFLHSARCVLSRECTKPRDCGSQQCCVLGANRYNRPRCVDLGSKGDRCRPYNNIPYNVTVTYPNRETLNLTNVYFMLCNCARHLRCDTYQGICRSRVKFTNDIK